MDKVKPLYIPKNKKWKGLTIYCNACKRNIKEVCKRNQKDILQCPHLEKHVFKLYMWEKGGKGKRITKSFTTRIYEEAVHQAIQSEERIKNEKRDININKITVTEKGGENRQGEKNDETPEFLLDAIARYIGWLYNEDVPEFAVRKRSDEYIIDVERGLKFMVENLIKKNNDVSSLTMKDINKRIIGEIYKGLQEKEYGIRSINKHLSYYESFVNWYKQEYDPAIRNWFEIIPREKVVSQREIVTQEEYDRLLNQITSENGLKYYDKGVKRIRNLYYPWLGDGIKLGLLTGRRRNELINLKFENIVSDSNGISYIRIEDFKTNRIKNRSKEAKKYIEIPVTNSLKNLLDELGYEKYKNSNAYVLAPEIKMSRTKVMSDALSRGFSHYFSQISDREGVTFKSLRKTYITQLTIFLGDNAKLITGHADSKVIEDFYLNKEMILKTAKGFEVYPEEQNRRAELEQTRDNTKTKDVSNEKQNGIGSDIELA